MSISESSESVVQREVRIAARPETVFPFFTDPALMARWFGRLVALEPTPGGALRVAINDQIVARGAFVEIVPPSRVVFTFGWEGTDQSVPPGSSTVEVVLVPDGDGTLVRLSHRDLPVVTRDEHAHGWEHYLARLATVAAGGDPGPDPMGQGQM
jgi:uncharacterized protein YndB with AHSA1/START domain